MKRSDATRNELRRAVASGWSDPDRAAALAAHERELLAEGIQKAARFVRSLPKHGSGWGGVCDDAADRLRDLAKKTRSSK